MDTNEPVLKVPLEKFEDKKILPQVMAFADQKKISNGEALIRLISFTNTHYPSDDSQKPEPKAEEKATA